MSWDRDTIAALSACPASSLRWAALGYCVGVRDGRDEVHAQIGEAGVTVAAAAHDVFRRVPIDELKARRAEVDYQPCPARCRACSRCIASEAYWSRGGRPFEGIEAERARVRGAVA